MRTLLAFVLAAAVGGCVSAPVRRFANDMVQQPTSVERLAMRASDPELEVDLEHVIVPNGPGSWVKRAAWDEYVMRLRNVGDRPVSIEQVYLMDPLGCEIEAVSVIWDAGRQTLALVDKYRAAGYEIDCAICRTKTEIALGGLGGAIVGGAPYSAALLLPLLPFAVLEERRAVANKLAIDGEFGKRLFHAPAVIPPGASASGSFFFPTVPSPKALSVRYSMEGKEVTLKLGLNELAGMHLPAVGKK